MASLDQANAMTSLPPRAEYRRDVCTLRLVRIYASLLLTRLYRIYVRYQRDVLGTRADFTGTT